jgi:group I intron endonuclease
MINIIPPLPTTGIYKFTSPTNKVYIGQSINVRVRWLLYRKNHCRGQIKLYRSFEKYSFENHQFEVIEECSKDILDEREIYWGNYYDVLGNNGLNLKLGNGRGSCSEETKQKMSNSAKNKPKSEIHKQNLKKPKYGVGLKGPKSILSKQKIGTSNSKPVFQYDKQGNFIKEWPNQTLAASSFGGTNSPISECCRGVRKTIYGYVWKYKEN